MPQWQMSSSSDQRASASSVGAVVSCSECTGELMRWARFAQYLCQIDHRVSCQLFLKCSHAKIIHWIELIDIANESLPDFYCGDWEKARQKSPNFFHASCTSELSVHYYKTVTYNFWNLKFKNHYWYIWFDLKDFSVCLMSLVSSNFCLKMVKLSNNLFG